MYLSRLILNPRNKQVIRDIHEPYEMHKTLMRAFPQNTNDAQNRFLWRLDINKRSGNRIVYGQSQIQPQWQNVITKHADYFLDPREADVDDNPTCKEIPDSKLMFSQGLLLAFRLRANPTKKIGSPLKSERISGKTRKNGRRIGLLKEGEQLAWLKNKSSKNGFRLISASVVCEDDFNHLSKGKKADTGNLSLLSVLFEGVLQVTEPKQFRQGVHSGIGPGKALGFGLLSLAPA